jgi:hypothetical protein
MAVETVAVNNPSFNMDYELSDFVAVNGYVEDDYGLPSWSGVTQLQLITKTLYTWLAIDDVVDPENATPDFSSDAAYSTAIEHIVELKNHPFETQTGGASAWLYAGNVGNLTFCASQPAVQSTVLGPATVGVTTDGTSYNLYIPIDVSPMFTAEFGATHNTSSSFIKIYQTYSSTIIYGLVGGGITQAEPKILYVMRITNDGIEVRFCSFNSYFGGPDRIVRLLTYTTTTPSEIDQNITIFYDNSGNTTTNKKLRRLWFVGKTDRNAISGSISENLDLTNFILNFKNPQTHEEIRKPILLDVSATPTYDVLFDNNIVSTVICTPYVKLWAPDTAYIAGDVVIASDTNNAPYYFEALIPGTTGGIEPVWNQSENGQTIDNTITWIRRDRIVRPQIHGPIATYRTV